MSTRLINAILPLTLLSVLVQSQSAAVAVTFSVTPATVSNTYVGPITLHIDGLTNTETVLIQKFLDLNANGAVDASDWLVQQFNLTDGQPGMVIGGVTNINVPGDTDTIMGQITAQLIFQNGDFMQNVAGQYVFTVSSPGGHFAPISQLFNVTNIPYAQMITGNVVSNNTSATVGNAVVIMFAPPRTGHSGPGNPLGAVVANSAGKYVASMPPGTYIPMVCARDSVFDYAASPVLTLAAGQTITTNLTLANATSNIAGNVVDANNSAITLPGLCLYAANPPQPLGLVSFTFTDANGNFNMPVTSGQWGLGTDYPFLSVHGYVGYYHDPVNQTNAGATGVTLTFSKATALFYGRVSDNLGNPLPGLGLESNDSNELYDMESYTDANGGYVLGALGGLSNDPWFLDINNGSEYYLFPQSDVDQNGGTNLTTGEAVLQNFIAIPATNTISGSLTANTGQPISGVEIYADATINGSDYEQEAVTDVNGKYSLNVANSTWDVGVDSWGDKDSLPADYLAPADQYPVVFNGNAVVNFTATLTLTFTTDNGTITYTITNGSITVMGFNFVGPSGSVTIPSDINGLTVTQIGDNAFQGQPSLTSVIIPGTVSSIGEYAFQSCSGLTNVYFEGNAPTADSTTFLNDNATAYYLPDTGDWIAFSASTGLTAEDEYTYTTNAGTITIVSYYGPGGDLIIPDKISGLPVTSIGDGAFFDSPLTSVTIPDSITNIGTAAFEQFYGLVQPSLTNVMLGTRVSSIGDFAFYGCPLTSIAIPNSVINIGTGAFYYCENLVSVTIPASVTTIGERPFAGCSSLTEISVSTNNPNYMSASGVLFDKNETTLIQYPAASSSTYYTIPNGVTTIGVEAFTECEHLTGVTIPESVTAIEDGAFQGCMNLFGLYFKGNAPSADSNVFLYDYFATVYYLAGSTGWGNYFANNNRPLPTVLWIPASLQVNIAPAMAIAAGAQWRLDAGAFESSGAIETNVGGGTHTISFTPVPGWNTPVDQSVIVTNGQVARAIGTYILTALFTAAPTNGVVPLTVNFSAANLDSGGNPINRWKWDFGDGSISTEQNPSHTYDRPGSFFPVLFATNNVGVTDTGSGPRRITAFIPPVYSGLVLNGGFETGDFTGWSSSGNSGSTFVDDGSQSGITPHSGNYEAVLGASGSLSYLSQTLATTTGGQYSLSLWLNSSDGENPNEFLVSWNGITLFDETNIPAIGWTNLHFLVTATGASTVLVFGFQDDPSYLELDDISFLAPAAPVNFATVGVRTNQFGFSISGTSDQVIVVEASTNLANPAWYPIETNTLTGGSFYFRDPQWTNYPGRFYRLRSP